VRDLKTIINKKNQERDLRVKFLFFSVLIFNAKQLNQQFLILRHCHLQIAHQHAIIVLQLCVILRQRLDTDSHLLSLVTSSFNSRHYEKTVTVQ